MTRSRWVASALLAAVFALGILVGGTATMFADREMHGHRGGRFSIPAYLRELGEELDLSADQQRAVALVFERHQPAMDSIWTPVRTQFESERQAIRRDIQALLTPEQQPKYQRLIARKDSLYRAYQRKRSDR